MGDGDLLSITEVSDATGLESSALRYYERMGLIASAARVGGRRQFLPSVLDRLAAIALFQEVGFTIAEIAELLRAGVTGRRWRAMAERKLREIDAHIERAASARELLAAALRCGCPGVETCELVAARRSRHRDVTRRLSITST